MKDEIVIYQDDQLSARLEVRIEEESVWLNRKQISMLFDRDVKTIGKHIANVLSEELKGFSVVAKFATTASDGKVYLVEYYNLDMIISIGYRVKSKRGIQFRIWANKVLKEYLLRGYAVNQRINRIENDIDFLKEKIELKTFSKSHDRFLILDEETVYHIGASLKNLGKKWFAFSKLKFDANEIIRKLENHK